MALVTARDGREVDSCSPEWREECAQLEREAQRIAALPGFPARLAAVDQQERKHGQLWADRLKLRLMVLRQTRMAAAIDAKQSPKG